MSTVYKGNIYSPVGFFVFMGAQAGPKELENPQISKQTPTEGKLPIEPISNLTTVADVVEDILKRMTEYHKVYIANTAEANLIQFHDGFGTSIRNRYSLYQNTELVKATGKKHPDDASGVIIKAV